MSKNQELEESNIKPNKVTQNKVIFSLNEEDKTCCVIGIDSNNNEIFIPRSVKYNSEEFIVTSIKRGSFFHSLTIKSLSFPEDSEIRIIEKKAFEYSSIESIMIPSSVIELQNGWCANTSELKKVIVNHNNKRYKNYEENADIIIGKSDIKSDIYDVLVFASRCITIATIPPYIRIISPYAFSGYSIQSISIPSQVTHISDYSFFDCINLERIKIPLDTKLETIGKHAFSQSRIEFISIPSSIIELKNNCFSGMPFLTAINIMQRWLVELRNRDDNIEHTNGFIAKKSDISKEEHDVLVIADRAIKSITIPLVIKQICSQAFQYSKIESITIPSTVKVLQKDWCVGTPNLKEVLIDKNNPYYKNYENDPKLILEKSDINNDEFDVLNFVCRDVKTVTIPPNIKRISSFAFEQSSIETVFIPSNVEQIGNCAFYNCGKLNAVEFSSDSKLEKIDKFAFAYSSLLTIKIPSSVIEICDSAFGSCENLITVEFSPDSKLERICQFAFDRSGIKNIIIPSSIKQICEFAFYFCNNITSIEIPVDSKIQTIEREILSFSDIEKFVIGPNITSIREGAFCFCSKFKSIEFSPNSNVKTIGADVFNDTEIESIFIPQSIVELKEGWCSGTYKLTKVTIDSNNKYYKNYDDNLVVGKSDKNCDEFDVLVFAARNIETVTIPSNIKKIASYAFSNCSIKKIFIPSQITDIGDNAFYNCNSLETVEFESDSQLQTIGEKGFNSTSINNFIIPPHVKQICSRVFANCNSLTSVDFQQNSEVQIIEKGAFEDSSIESITIPSTVIELEDGWCSDTPKLNKIIIKDDNKRYKNYDKIIIGKSDINNNEHDVLVCAARYIKVATIPTNIKIISPFAFCNSLINSISIPPNVTQISDYSFFHCLHLKRVEIPNDSQLQTIGKLAFAKSKIDSIYIPRNIRTLDINSFYDCQSLKIIEIGRKIDIELIYFDIILYCKPIIMIPNDKIDYSYLLNDMINF